MNLKTPSYTFEKSHRLLKPAQFRHVFDSCERKLHAKHLMAFVVSNDLDHPRLGLAITKKKVPTAVARNRLKRRSKEIFRLCAHQLSAKDIVIIAKRPITDLDDLQLNDEIKQIIDKLQ